MQKKKLRKEIKIRIVSPSANIVDEPESKELIKKAEETLKRLSIKVDYSKHAFGKRGFLSGTAEERAEDIMSAFEDKEVDAIISSQGGDNSNDLLELLDYEKISRNEKPFFGISDITILLNVIAIRSDITTYHGIDFLWGLGKNATKYTEDILNIFLKEGKIKIIKNPNVPEWKCVKPGSGEGTILGGCLSSFCLLLGTKNDPLEMLNAPYILILEDIGEIKSIIRSKLTQIKQHRKFTLCRGIILGNFAFCEQKIKENNISVEELAVEVFKDSNIPIARIEEIGHCVENIIIPIGGRGRLSCENAKVSLEFI